MCVLVPIMEAVPTAATSAIVLTTRLNTHTHTHTNTHTHTHTVSVVSVMLGRRNIRHAAGRLQRHRGPEVKGQSLVWETRTEPGATHTHSMTHTHTHTNI